MLLTTAAMRDQDRVRVRLGIVGDEESEEEAERGSDHLVDSGFIGDFAITGEPTDLHIGVEAKGVLALRLEVGGTAAHGATPWLGDNAVLNAIDVFRSIESLPFARQSSELFDRPSINLGRIWGGDALNKVPDRCVIDVDIRYLPDQDPAAVLEEVRGIAGAEAAPLFTRPPATVDRDSPFVRALREAATAHHDGEPMSVGRDGASDAVSFLRVGRAGGRVRPGRRRPPRPRGVGLGLLAGDLPADARHLPARRPGPARRLSRWARLQEAAALGRPRAAAEAEALLVALHLASVVIVAVTAAATATSILLYIGSIANALSHHNVYKDKLDRYLSKVHGGNRRTSSSSAPTSGPTWAKTPAAPTRRSCCASTPTATRSR